MLIFELAVNLVDRGLLPETCSLGICDSIDLIGRGLERFFGESWLVLA